MKHLFNRLGVVALAFLLVAFATPARASEAVKLSFVENTMFYRGGNGYIGNAGFNGGDWSKQVFNGDFTDYRYQNTAGAYLVIDLTPNCTDPDGQPFVTDVLVGHAGNTQYSLYYTTETAPDYSGLETGSGDNQNWYVGAEDNRTWTPIVERTQAGGTKTYGVNAIATAVKYVFDTSRGWGGQDLAEIEVQGYEYVPPKAVKISSRQRAKMYRSGQVNDGANGNFGINGNDSANNLFDGDFEYCIYQNVAGAYMVLDTTVYTNDVSSGAGYYVTDVLIGHAGNTQYSLYYTTEAAPAAGSTSDNRTWTPIVEQTQAGGKKTYGVNAIATAVKYVWDTSLGWGGQSLAEIEIWGMDPSTIACLHPNIDSVPWTVATNSFTCTEFGYKMRVCPDCGKEFREEDSGQPPAHVYEAHLTQAGTVAAYGTGYYECTNCHDRVDFSEPDNLVRSANASLTFGPLVPGQVLFTTYTVSSVWHADWGIKAADMFNGSWTMNYTCWATYDLNNQGVDFYFGAPIDLTSVDVAAHNHNHTLLFYNVDDATGTTNLIGRQVVHKAESGEEQRFLVPLRSDVEGGTVSRHLWVTSTDDEGYNIWGSHGMCIVELEPYGTIPGANKIKAKAAMIGDDGYDTLAEAFAAAKDGDVITLVTNITLTAALEITNSVTINLDEYNIAATDSRALWVKQGNVTITGTGTISANGDNLGATSSVIRVGDAAVNENAAKLTIGPNVVVSSGKCYGVTVFGKNSGGIEFVLNGTVAISSPWAFHGCDAAISGNGSSGLAPTTITINNGANVYSTNSAAIYHPGAGTLTVNGGTITGTHGIVARGGSVEVAGGVITATGDTAKQIGDAAALLPCSAVVYDTATSYPGYEEESSGVAISGGSFAADNGDALTQIRTEGTPAAITVSGGTFDAPVPEEYCAEGFAPVDDGNGHYGVKYDPVAKIGAKIYTTLAAAVAAAKDGDTVELTTNVTLSARVEPKVGAGTAITINLGGYTITTTATCGNGSAFDIKSGSVLITNGVIIGVAQTECDPITVRSGAAVEVGGMTITIDSRDGACVYPFAGATALITSGTYSNNTQTDYVWQQTTGQANGWRGMVVNQGNVAEQLLTITGGSFSGVDPALGDDSWTAGYGTFLAPGHISVLTDGVWVVRPAWPVTFVLPGDSVVTNVAAGDVPVYPGETPMKESTLGYDYFFLGWAADEFETTPLAELPPATQATNFWALFGANAIEYRITLNLEGGELGGDDSASWPENERVYTVEDSFDLPTPAKTGCEFVGWVEGEVDSPMGSVSISMSTGNRVFAAVWEETLPPEIDLTDPETAPTAAEIAAGAVPAGVQTDETTDEEEFVVCFHGKAGVTYQLQGSTTLGLTEEQWKSPDRAVGDAVRCTVDGQLVRLEFPMDGANVPDRMFFRVGATRTSAASGD